MKKGTLIFLLFGVMLASLGAVELSDRGYTVSNQRVEDGITLYDVRDNAGNPLTVGTATGSFTASDMNVLEIVRETFFNMEFLEVADLKVVFSLNRADIVVIPRRYRYEDLNFAALMPSGMQFIYTDFLEYDFRMLVDGLFVRMQGQYFNEQQFVERLARAGRNPAPYIQSTDPRFVFRPLDEVEKLLDEFRSFRTEANQGIRGLEESLRRERAALRNEFDRELAQESARFDQELARAREHFDTEIADVRGELEQEVEELQVVLEGLTADYLELLRQFNVARRAVLVFENRGFFGGLRIPDEAVVEEIVQLKLDNPGITIEEAEAAINEGREEAVSGKVVTLVFSLYFNEFE